jgi:hypothetical protein
MMRETEGAAYRYRGPESCDPDELLPALGSWHSRSLR